MDYDDFERMIELHRNTPVIVVANIGSTMKEACDDIKKIKRIIALVHSFRCSIACCH
ncbi:MAG: histidine decarboxylase [Flavobacteriales bacterium]|jgi:histidine decarboxylase